jgi:hypothetical protein
MAIQHPSQIIKSQDAIVYLGEVSGARPTATVSNLGVVTIANQPSTMEYLTGVTNASVAINDNEQEYYLLGNGGFADSVVTTTRAQASITTYFQRDLDGTGSDQAVQTTGYDEALTLALKARNDKDAELWVEVYKEITDLNYDITCFAARVMNYSESYPADNLIEVTFDLMSRGPVKAGTIVLPSTIMPSAPGS